MLTLLKNIMDTNVESSNYYYVPENHFELALFLDVMCIRLQ